MDDERARALLQEERQRVEQLISGTADDAGSDRAEADVDETGDIADPAERQTAEEVDDAILEQLRARLDVIVRAQQRLADGTYGRSVLSGTPIPDDRLEADPAAELTVEEAAAQLR
jgi:DnaK suppressor protein